ncbi:MAG: hypothetical protein ACRDWS_01095 [Acidimicrobiia bacterium]
MTTEGPNPPVGQPPPTPPILGEPASTAGMSGCAKAAIIGGAIILVVGIALVALVIFGLTRFAGDVEEAFEEEPCQFISSEEASEVIGARVEATSGDSALGAVLGLVRDTRLLGDAPSCFISSEEATIQIWVSVHDGSDAAQVFAAGTEVAEGQVVTEETTDSGSITVESDAFRGEDVPGLGEEAFCTEVGAVVSGGVFARSDDRVVYVSALAMAENGGAEGFDGSFCERAIPIAEALLG